MVPRALPRLDRHAVALDWLRRQGLARPRGAVRLTRRAFVDHLERTGGLQLDTVNVVERAHYLTLWSRFGPFDRARVDRWVHRDGVAFEYWRHEASILPLSELPYSRRRMKRFPGSWVDSAWWPRYRTSPGSKQRVLRRLREEGPLESGDFERRPDERGDGELYWGTAVPKEDKRSLKLLWHAGRVAVRERRHFRCVYDLAERVYPGGGVEGPAATQREVEDRWLLASLAANGVASERHLAGYFTAPVLGAAERRRILERNRRRGAVVEVAVEGLRGPCWARPEDLEALAAPGGASAPGSASEPDGTTLISPFDSLLWQRARARELLDFDYRLEIYTPPAKRRFGYYALPILHQGRLVGRLDPKLHRERGRLEVRALHLEPGFRPDRGFERGLGAALADLAAFTGAAGLELPSGLGGWGRRLGG